MLSRVRSAIRRARSAPFVGAVIGRIDRFWWARTILRADVVDLPFVVAQAGRRITRRAAVRRYVRDGFRAGFSLNPLACERTISRQLSDSDRVPALYAYLVNDRQRLEVSPAWSALDYAERHPEAATDSGGPLGHAWRSAQRQGRVRLGRGDSAHDVPWSSVRSAAAAAAQAVPGPDSADEPESVPAFTFVCEVAADERDPDEALVLAAEVISRSPSSAQIHLERPSTDVLTQAYLLHLAYPNLHVSLGEPVVKDAELATDIVVVRGPHAEISPAAVIRLAHAATAGPAAPLWVAPDGTIASAGVVGWRGARHHLLAHHPVEDAVELGAAIQVPEIAGSTYSRRRGDDMHSGGTTLLDIAVEAPREPPHEDAPPLPDTDVEALLRAAGWVVAPDQDTPTRPMVMRAAGGSRPLRWAIKTAAPAGRAGQAWGDTHFAQALARALRSAGMEAVVDAIEASHRPTTSLDDVNLVLRGPVRIRPPRTGTSVLWIISHPDEITAAELADFDLVFAASRSWAQSASARFGREVQPLLQCTDTTRFRPRGTPRGDDIVFVGTARGIPRPSVVGPLEAGIPVKVFGPDWTGYIPGSAIAATSVPNEELPRLYESAAVVLNDHWPAMRAAGFISNRPYDVVAAGGRVISDSVEGIEAEFGGAVRTYDSVPELIELLSGDIDLLFPDEAQLERAAEAVRSAHSFESRAGTLIQAVDRLLSRPALPSTGSR
ncbi:hypothetical protein ACFT30_05925 [Microbacterium ureisolvens]|uniref:glycosyltransferase family protein n=1 Tax=Microbacterium ureisolvens TaxID=2781186 RepID=UPI00363C59DD